MTIEQKSFGQTQQGEQASLYTLTNNNSLVAGITDYGAKLVNLNVPDAQGNMDDVVLGFDSVEGYQSKRDHKFGATIGPVAGRISEAEFYLDNKTYKLQANQNGNTLHSGDKQTLQTMMWQAKKSPSPRGCQLVLTCRHKAGTGGFPGNVDVVLTYTLTNDNSLILEYKATTDAPTPICLTNHSYFNLAGQGQDASTIEKHVLKINAARYTPWGENSLPSGKIESLKDTFLDFSRPKKIGQDLPKAIQKPTLGYDHYFVLDKSEGQFTLAAQLADPKSKRLMEVFTDQPGLVFYSANHLPGQAGKPGQTYTPRSAVCLETQGFPGALDNSQFPSIILRPGATYTHTTVYRFSVVPT